MNKKIPFHPPEYESEAFNCPHCLAYSSMYWGKARTQWRNSPNSTDVELVDFAKCTQCKKWSIWEQEEMIFPEPMSIDPANDDLNKEIINDYNEAALILAKSPRGSAALLRLAVQKLCIQLGEPGKDLNTDISNLVKKGLSVTIQQALDALRVIGNEAVHPGELSLKDNPKIASALFRLINKIAETMITEPKEIQAIYDNIPDRKKKAINKRDKNEQ